MKAKSSTKQKTKNFKNFNFLGLLAPELCYIGLVKETESWLGGQKMKNFNNIFQMVTSQDVLVCKATSGLSVAYEVAHFNGLTKSGNIKMVTESGSKFQIKEEWGKAIMVGKAKDLFLKSESEINDNYFKSIVL